MTLRTLEFAPLGFLLNHEKQKMPKPTHNTHNTQVMLERHVNNHFSEGGSSGTSHSGPRKSTETGDTARKRLKRAGVKLKFRQLPFSARIFDFFDAGNMAGIRHTVAELEERSCTERVRGDTIELTARVLGKRIHPDGQRWLNVRWTPNN